MNIKGTMHAIRYTLGNRQFLCTSTKHMDFEEAPEAWEVALISQEKTAQKTLNYVRKKDTYFPNTKAFDAHLADGSYIALPVDIDNLDIVEIKLVV